MLKIRSVVIDPKQRKKMQIRLSRDGGKTWQTGSVLVDGFAAYSDLVQVAPGYFLAAVEVEGYQAIRVIPFLVPGLR